MNGPSVYLSDDDSDSVMDVTPTRPPFQIPGRSGGYIAAPTGAAGPTLGGDILINKRKVSSEVLESSRSSSGGSGSGSDYSGTTDEGSEYSDDDGGGIGGAPALSNRLVAEKTRMESENQEKREILYQMDRIESKGYNLPRKFTMQSDLDEMRGEYHRILREKEVDASIRFQRKMMMAFVTGLEYFNTRFDPFDFRLNGWSEQVHENITDYDDIFEELHDKYKSSGQKMAPELRLLMSMSGSAFMFHLTSSMFKQQPLPNVEAVLRSNPDLMRQFSNAAASSYVQSKMAPQQAPQPSQGANMSGIFGMMGNLMGGLAPQPPRAPMPPPQRPSPPAMDIHAAAQAAQAAQAQQRASSYETMSVSDEEITSIIEDTADLAGILGNSRPARGRGGRAGGKRTLQL